MRVIPVTDCLVAVCEPVSGGNFRMHAKVIAVLLLLAVPAAMPAALAINASDSAAALAHGHTRMLQHACCPQLSGTAAMPAPVQAPRSDEHRCCFLRGPQSSLPMSTASTEQLALAGHMPVELAGFRHDSGKGSLTATRDSVPTPPLSIQMSVVLRN